MTYKKLAELMEQNSIPENVELLSDSGWEVDATSMDGVFYNPEKNIIVFTMNTDDARYQYDKFPWVHLELWKERAKEAYCEYEPKETFLNVYKVKDLYVVHGEQSVYCFDKCFQLVWQFQAGDILVTQDGSPSVKLSDDYIDVTDYEGKRCKISYDGHVYRK